MSPNRFEQPAVFLATGDPNLENTPTLAYPGTLGARFTVIEPTRAVAGNEAGRSKRYQIVRSDSAMTVAPFRGAVAWWSDKTQYLVTTNSPAVAVGRNRIAGVFLTNITPGNFCCVALEGPHRVKLIDAVNQGNVVLGAYIIPSATNAKADVVATATAPTQTPLGVVGGGTVLDFNVADLTVVVDLAVPETT